MKSNLNRPYQVGQLAVLATAIAVLAAGCSISFAHDSALADQTLTNLSPVEAEALGDKVVSFSELEQAGEALSACLQLAGFNTSFEGPNFGPDSVVAEIATGSESLTVAEVEAASIRQEGDYDDCRSETEAVSAVWVLQNQASGRELDRAIENLPGCLIDAGVNVSEDASLEYAAEAAAAFRADAETSDTAIADAETCLGAAAAVTGSPFPGLAEALSELDVASE